MNIVCLDMEGVLVPEIWIAFSEASGIPELRDVYKRQEKAAVPAASAEETTLHPR